MEKGMRPYVLTDPDERLSGTCDVTYVLAGK